MGRPWEFFANPENSNHDTDLDGLAKSAHKSFGIIELWQKQTSFHSTLEKNMIESILKQGPSYYSTIHQSAKIAQEGCSFAQDAIDFCQRLLIAKDSVETLKSGLDDIKEIAKRAHQGSEEIQNQFKRIRTELFKISKDAPSGVNISQIEKDALSQLKYAVDELSTLIQHVNSFADWWGKMNTSLMNLEEILPQLRLDGKNPFRTETVTERWIGVHRKYVWYQREISEVEDYYKNLSGEVPTSTLDAASRASANPLTAPNGREIGRIEDGKKAKDGAKQAVVGYHRQIGDRQNARINAQRLMEENEEAEAERRVGEERAAVIEAKKRERKTKKAKCPAGDVATAQDLTTLVHQTGIYKFAFGGSADIWKGELVENDSGRAKEVAVKVLRSVQPGKSISFLHESRVWSAVHHQHISPLLGVSWDFHRPDTPCLVLPYYLHGNITSYTKRHPHADKLKLLGQAASGISYLHDMSIIHGDVKGSNILISDNGEAMVTDFGLSRALHETGFTTQTRSETPRYMAPELITCPDEQGEFVPRVTQETDVWAFSMTAVEVFTESEPFPHIKSDIGVAMFVVKGGRPKRRLCRQINDTIWTALLKCWSVEPNRRPSIADLAELFTSEPLYKCTMRLVE